MTQLTTRNADLSAIASLLAEQRAKRIDMVVPAGKLRSLDGLLGVEDFAITADGVDTVYNRFDPTSVAIEGIADKLSIPAAYLRRMQVERPDLFDANINGWLHGGYVPDVGLRDFPGSAGPGSDYFWPADKRSFLVRGFIPEDPGGTGIARAFLSDTYRIVDNLDVLTVAMEAVIEADPLAQVVSADLSERRMYVKIATPSVSALAPKLLEGYRSPFEHGALRAGDHGQTSGSGGALQQLRDHTRGRQVGDIVFAGFILSNSEVGAGAMTITPSITVLACLNGMTITKDAMRKIHLGGRMEQGTIEWSADTLQKNLELVQAQTKDAVSTFLRQSYVEKVIAEIEAKAGIELTEPAKTVAIVTKQLGISEQRTQGVLDHFIRGGQTTAGGIFSAVTSYAQVIPDADEAMAFEALGLQALDLAVAAAN